MLSSIVLIPFIFAPSLAHLTKQRKTEAQEARILPAAEECTPYSLPAVEAIIGSYPAIWSTANVSQSGISAYDVSLFAAINASIPNILPRGNRAGDFSGVSYDAVADSDCWWTATRCNSPKLPQITQPDLTQCDTPNTWGFTLDDGPNCSHNAYYDYLLSIEQKATLFYTGSNVLDWPLEAQRGLADGHEICAHTFSHPYMTSLTNEEAFAELYYSKKAIRDVIGITVQCWRPPYGDVDDRIRYIAQALGMRTVVWEDDTFDYEIDTVGKATVEKNYQRILDQQANGNYSSVSPIILSHELDERTMAISKLYLPRIIDAFTGVMPIAVCTNNSQPYLEQNSTYVYPNYEQWINGTRTISLAGPTAVPNSKNFLTLPVLAGVNETRAPLGGGSQTGLDNRLPWGTPTKTLSPVIVSQSAIVLASGGELSRRRNIFGMTVALCVAFLIS